MFESWIDPNPKSQSLTCWVELKWLLFNRRSYYQITGKLLAAPFRVMRIFSFEPPMSKNRSCSKVSASCSEGQCSDIPICCICRRSDVELAGCKCRELGSDVLSQRLEAGRKKLRYVIVEPWPLRTGLLIDVERISNHVQSWGCKLSLRLLGPHILSQHSLQNLIYAIWGLQNHLLRWVWILIQITESQNLFCKFSGIEWFQADLRLSNRGVPRSIFTFLT